VSYVRNALPETHFALAFQFIICRKQNIRNAILEQNTIDI